MKNTDLRIKNKLQKDNGEIFTVLRIDGTNDVLVEEQRGLLTLDYNLFGIPLTGEWLIKFGFAEDKRKLETIYRLGVFEFATSCKTIDIEISGLHEIVTYSTDVKFVHQLQNLYFALTGVELQLSST